MREKWRKKLCLRYGTSGYLAAIHGVFAKNALLARF
jgi:hypothetical protein